MMHTRKSCGAMVSAMLCGAFVWGPGAGAQGFSTVFTGVVELDLLTPTNPEAGGATPTFTIRRETYPALESILGSMDDYAELTNGAPANYSPTGNLYRMENRGFSIPAGENFAISQLTYFNAQTWSGSNYRGIPVRLTLDFNEQVMPNAPQDVAFNFFFQLDITDNGGVPGGVPDTLTYVNSAPTQSFTYNDRRYTIELQGFTPGVLVGGGGGGPGVQSAGGGAGALNDLVSSFTLPEDLTVRSNLIAQIIELSNNTVVTAAGPIDFGRRMVGSTPTATLTVNKTGSDGTGFAALGSSGGIAVNPVTADLLGGTRNSTVTVGLLNNTDGSAVPGRKQYSVTIDNLALTSDGPGLGSDDPDEVVDVLATIVRDRVITAAAADFGRVIVGTPATAPTTLITTGSDDQRTRIRVNAGAYSDGVAVVDVPSSTLFNDASVALPVDVSLSAPAAGPYAGRITLDVSNGGLTGEGLVGESVVPVNIDYTASAVANRVITADAVDLGRVMVGTALPSSGLTTFRTTGDDNAFTRVTLLTGTYTDASALLDIDADTLFDNATDTANGTITLTGTGSQVGTITLTAAPGGGLAGEGLVGESVVPVDVNYSAVAVADRVITADAVDLGRVMVGTALPSSGLTTFRTTGDDNSFTRLTLNAGSYTAGTATLDVAADQLFDDADDSTTGSLTLTGSGSQVGTITLTAAPGGGLAGEGLVGESVVPVDVNYSAVAVAQRVVTATSVNLGRHIVGRAVSGTSTLSTTGDDDAFTRIGVALTGGPDGNGAAVAGGTGTTFNSAASAGSRTLAASFATPGAVSGSIGLAVTGEGLVGEGTYADVAVNYLGNPVADRVITAAPVALGAVIRGHNAPLSGTTTFSTTGADDVATRVTLNAGTYNAGAGGVVIGGNTLFNGAGVTATGAVSVGPFTGAAGVRGGAIELAGGAGLTGEGLAGEAVVPVNVGYSYELWDRGNASFSTTADVNTLTLDLGSITLGGGGTNAGFALTNLLATAGYTAPLAFTGVAGSTGNTGAFNLTLPANGATLAAGDGFSALAGFNAATAGTFNASYTLGFTDDLTGITGDALAQTLVLNLVGTVTGGVLPDLPVINNPSFEGVFFDDTSPTPIGLPDGGRTLGMSNTFTATAQRRVVASWFSVSGDELDSSNGVINPTSGQLTDPVPDGQLVAYVGGFGGPDDPFFQPLTGTLSAGYRYELQFDVGQSLSGGFDVPRVELLIDVGGTLVPITPDASVTPTPAPGEFETWTLTYDVAGGDPEAGAELFLRVGQGGAGGAFLDLFRFAFAGDPALVGDLNGDGVLDVADLDVLYGALWAAAGPGVAADAGDVDGDGFTTLADQSFWLDALIGTVVGDLNLDQRVDDADLALLQAAWLTAGAGYGGGDLNADGLTNVLDLNLLQSVWLHNAPDLAGLPLDRSWIGSAGQVIPEPSLALPALGLALLTRRRRRAA